MFVASIQVWEELVGLVLGCGWFTSWSHSLAENSSGNESREKNIAEEMENLWGTSMAKSGRFDGALESGSGIAAH